MARRCLLATTPSRSVESHILQHLPRHRHHIQRPLRHSRQRILLVRVQMGGAAPRPVTGTTSIAMGTVLPITGARTRMVIPDIVDLLRVALKLGHTDNVIGVVHVRRAGATTLEPSMAPMIVMVTECPILFAGMALIKDTVRRSTIVTKFGPAIALQPRRHARRLRRRRRQHHRRRLRRHQPRRHRPHWRRRRPRRHHRHNHHQVALAGVRLTRGLGIPNAASTFVVTAPIVLEGKALTRRLG